MRSRNHSNPKLIELSNTERLVRPVARPSVEQEQQMLEALLLSRAFRDAESVTTRVTVDAAGAPLEGELTLPSGATGIVLFAHCSDTCRHSARSRQTAQVF